MASGHGDKRDLRVSRPVLLVLVLLAAVITAAVVWQGQGDGPNPAAPGPAAPSAGPAGSPTPAGSRSPAGPATPDPRPTPPATTTGATRTPASVPSPSPADPSSSPRPSAPALETVPPAEPQPTVAVPLKQEARLGRGLVARVVRMEAVTGVARGAGEVAGPALRVTVQAENLATTATSLELGQVLLFYGEEETPAIQLSGPGVSPFPAQLAAGDTARGTFVFNVPPGQRTTIRVDFTYSAQAPRAIFTGSAAPA